ncbi:MAG: FAD-dependent oxidoreductase [Candidatus Omnitrophota bacterium]
MKIYDLIILGAGPAGITAAVYASRKKLDFLIITQDVGGQAIWSGDIENYTGYQFISGPELVMKFQEHLKAFSIPVNMSEDVRALIKEDDIIKVITDKAEYLSRTVIIATGKRPKALNVPGEVEFRNKGLTYCATCDGPLFKSKDVAVIGGGNSGLDAALQMMKISPKVYIITNSEELTGDPVMVEKIKQANNVEIWYNSSVIKISGEKFVEALELKKQGQIHTIPVKGIFVEVGLIPNTGFAGITERNEKEEVIVDCANKTDIAGIFAAGDVTNVPEKQIIVACGEGAKAALSAGKYLSTHVFT